MKPAISFYHHLLGDASAAETTSEALVDQPVQALLDCEDKEIMWDLRFHAASSISSCDQQVGGIIVDYRSLDPAPFIQQ